MIKLEKGTKAFTLLLAALTAVGPLSTDMYLPSLPAISKALETDHSMVQLTLSIFIAGFAVGQIFYGPLSDRFGRRPVICVGLGIYVLGSIACFVAPNIEFLIAARFAQAIGASAAIVLARAIVRDLYDGSQAARLLSMLGALMGVVPLIAPVLGGFMEITYGWRANFAITSIIAAILLIVVVAVLPETLNKNHKRRWSFMGMLSDFGDLLKHPSYVRYLIAVCLSFAGLFVLISASSFVLQEHFGISEIGFGLTFSLCVAGYILGTLIGGKLTHTKDVETLTFWGSIILGVSGAAMIMLTAVADQQLWHFLIPMFFSMVGIGFVMPQSMAGALTPFATLAGTASSLIGFIQNAVAAIFGIVATFLIGFEPNALMWIIGGTGIANFLLSYTYRKGWVFSD